MIQHKNMWSPSISINTSLHVNPLSRSLRIISLLMSKILVNQYTFYTNPRCKRFIKPFSLLLIRAALFRSLLQQCHGMKFKRNQ